MTMEDYYIFTEIVRCGLIGKIALESYHKYHTKKVHVFGREEDFKFIDKHPNTIFHIFDKSDEIVHAFDKGHLGTAMVWTKVILELSGSNNKIIHFDSDVVFRGNIIDDICEKLNTYDIVGSMRNYPNNPNKRDDVRHLQDITQTYCFGFNKQFNYIKEYHLLARFVENTLDQNVVMEMMYKYRQYNYVPTIDYFDPLAFCMIKNGAKLFIYHVDILGGCTDLGTRINNYGILNKHMDFGDKISHFASLGSGLNFLTMMQNNKQIQVEKWYVEYALKKLDLYLRVFYNTNCLERDKNDFLEMEEPLKIAFNSK